MIILLLRPRPAGAAHRPGRRGRAFAVVGLRRVRAEQRLARQVHAAVEHSAQRAGEGGAVGTLGMKPAAPRSIAPSTVWAGRRPRARRWAAWCQLAQPRDAVQAVAVGQAQIEQREPAVGAASTLRAAFRSPARCRATPGMRCSTSAATPSAEQGMVVDQQQLHRPWRAAPDGAHWSIAPERVPRCRGWVVVSNRPRRRSGCWCRPGLLRAGSQNCGRDADAELSEISHAPSRSVRASLPAAVLAAR